jgi:hypothetical protein
MNFGFIITRHVNSSITNEYWIECYKCIRNYYPDNKIIIIDDNSDYSFITEFEIYNCIIIQSEFPKRGEILSYYYFYKYNFFDKAIIIHDSVFINNRLQDDILNNDIKFLWHFNSKTISDKVPEIIQINKLKNYHNVLNLYNDYEKWHGCFGVQSIISYNFLINIVNKYNIFNLLEYIKCRNDRCAFERVFAIICILENNNLLLSPSVFGLIFNHVKNDYNYNQYIEDKEKDNLYRGSYIKIFTGR